MARTSANDKSRSKVGNTLLVSVENRFEVEG
jgi:hypothetical protein